jgi:benzoyl-CoA reductase/2-hydroxyglutaryl-CoA dehydratase subunit BcrC/BadD/HgdB
MPIETILNAARRPLEALSARARASGRPLGLALTACFPVEVLDALGLEGALLPALPRDGFPAADAVLQSYTCACVRSIADELLSGSLPVGLLAGTSGCDAQLAVGGALEGAGVKSPMVALRLPIAVGTPLATRRAEAAMAEFVERATAALGRPLDPARLEEAVAMRQQVRERVLALFAGMKDGSVDPALAYSAGIASWVMAPRELLDGLASPPPAASAGGVPALLSGSVLPSPAVVDDLAAMGVRVVADDTETGSRGASRRVARDGGSLLDAVARSTVDGIAHGPVRAEDGRTRIDRVVAAARKAGAKAAFLVNFKFCDPHAFEAPRLMAALRDAGIPSIVVEVDREPGLPSRERTRIQTLVEAVA